MHSISSATGTLSADTAATSPGTLGIWWFLASEIVTFGGLLGSYIAVRLAHPPWADASAHLSALIATIKTVVLLTSSLTMVLAWDAVERQDAPAIRTHLGYTVALGCVFLLIKAFEWHGKLSHGLVPSASGVWAF